MIRLAVWPLKGVLLIRVLSLGAGVQSTTVLLMSCVGELPKFDAAVFADTQWEPKAVYSHLDWLESTATQYGIPVHRVTAGNLREDAIEFRSNRRSADGKRFASMPLFVKSPNGSTGIINRQCTKEYKIIPVERFIRRELLGLNPRQRAPRNAVEHYFGISADETYRMRHSPNHWQTFRYPLIEDVVSPKADQLFDRGFDRQDCLDWLAVKGFPRPPRSACIGCPFHSDAEWMAIKDDPEEWRDAVEFDRLIRQKDRHAGLRQDSIGLPFLHRSCVPLDQVVFRDAAGGFANECGGVCGV